MQGKWPINRHHFVQMWKTPFWASVQHMVPSLEMPSPEIMRLVRYQLQFWLSQEWTPAPGEANHPWPPSKQGIPGPQSTSAGCAWDTGLHTTFSGWRFVPWIQRKFPDKHIEDQREWNERICWGEERRRERQRQTIEWEGRPWIGWLFSHHAHLYSLFSLQCNPAAFQ